jgi:rhodanese-related sulfurtransferase
MRPLSVRAFRVAWEAEDALVIDARSKEEFAKEYIPGSVFFGLDGSFAAWVGALVPELQQPILFVAEPGKEEEVVTRLSRVGYDNPIGFLEGGVGAWKAAGEEVDSIEEVAVDEFTKFYNAGMPVLDVRKASEYEAQHLVGAANCPLDFINKSMEQVKRDQKYYLYCATGYRSLIAASILKARGFGKVVNVVGGFKALQEAGLPMTEFSEQVTEL